MQTKRNDMWAVSDEATSKSAAVAGPTSSIVVLDEASLEKVAGGGIWGDIKDAVKDVRDKIEDVGGILKKAYEEIEDVITGGGGHGPTIGKKVFVP